MVPENNFVYSSHHCGINTSVFIRLQLVIRYDLEQVPSLHALALQPPALGVNSSKNHDGQCGQHGSGREHLDASGSIVTAGR